MNLEQRLHFRNQLRQARAAALRDAEGFMQIVHAIEGLGEHLCRRAVGLAAYRKEVGRVAKNSIFATELPQAHPAYHCRFDVLYELVRDRRNQAAHYGAYARNLTTHSIELALILEDALMNDCEYLRDFMVADPVCGAPWQPLSFCRQQMLLNSFSFLPIPMMDKDGAHNGWSLLSDYRLTAFLHGGKSNEERKRRLAMTVELGVEKGLELEDAVWCSPTTPVYELDLGHKPILVLDPEDETRVSGIITAYDLL